MGEHNSEPDGEWWAAANRETCWIVFYGALPYLSLVTYHVYRGLPGSELPVKIFTDGAPYMSLLTIAGLTSANLSYFYRRPQTYSVTATNRLRAALTLIVVLCVWGYVDTVNAGAVNVPMGVAPWVLGAMSFCTAAICWTISARRAKGQVR